jgi:hypothetical protein
VAALRGTLERAGDLADLPWWLWTGLYVLLVAVSVALAVWPAPLAAVARWWERLRVVPSADVTRRVLTVVHIGLALTMLIGLAAPPGLGAALRGELQARYALAVEDELQARGEQAAYQAIAREFSAGAITGPQTRPLVTVVSKIHDVASPAPGTDDSTSTERDLARRLGQAQAVTLQLSRPPAVDAAAVPADLDSPARNAGDLRQQLDELDEQQHRAAQARRQAEEAGDLAAAVVAGLLQAPHVGGGELVGVIREYLSGLVEGSRLRNVFAAWVQKRAEAAAAAGSGGNSGSGDNSGSGSGSGQGGSPPGAPAPGGAGLPAADKMVLPDPPRLEIAALAVLVRVRFTVMVADPLAGDQAEHRTESESPLDAAVDLVNEARFLQEDTGRCTGCPQPLKPGEEPFEGHDDHPVEPEPHEGFVP